MTSPRTRSTVLIALTTLWIAHIVFFLVLTVTLHLQPVMESMGIVELVVVFGVHMAMTFLGIGLLVTYSMHVYRNRQMSNDSDRKLKRFLLILFLGPVAMPLYWSRHIRSAAA